MFERNQDIVSPWCMLAPAAFMKDDELFHFIKLMCECPIYDGYSAKCCKEKKIKFNLTFQRSA